MADAKLEKSDQLGIQVRSHSCCRSPVLIQQTASPATQIDRSRGLSTLFGSRAGIDVCFVPLDM